MIEKVVQSHSRKPAFRWTGDKLVEKTKCKPNVKFEVEVNLENINGNKAEMKTAKTNIVSTSTFNYVCLKDLPSFSSLTKLKHFDTPSIKESSKCLLQFINV